MGSTTETTTLTEEQPKSFTLHVDSAYGPINRTVQTTPPRDALPGEVPIIDLAPLTSSNSTLSDRLALAAQLRDAATKTGFFYVINHGIPEDLTNSLVEASKKFFHQSPEQKNKVYFDHQIEGWQPLSTEQINKSEQIDVFEKLKIMYRPSFDPDLKKEEYPDVKGPLGKEFPFEQTGVPELERAYRDVFAARLRLTRQLLRIVALALELEEGYFEDKVKVPQASVVLNYYPYISSALSSSSAETETEVQPETKHGSLGSHTDFSLITLLWQDTTGGLQILSPDGQWLNAKPIPNSLVCNIGDMLTMITRGKFVSDVHRARNAREVERVSIPFFIGLAPGTRIEVVESCEEEGRQKEVYEGVTAGEWLRKRVMDVKLGKTKRDGEA